MIDKFLAFTTETVAASGGSGGGEAFYLFFSGTSQILLANQSLSGTIFGYFIFILVIFLSVILPLMFIVPTILNWRKNRRLLRHGEPAQAKILKIWDTGVTVNDNPQVGLLLAVYPENRDPYQAETKKVISRLQIPQIQIGASVEVRYDRQNPLEVALVI
ncbi:MAG TPA: DUF3592 domain-containing protein [Pyrinomonadaceae bacterium]